MSIKSKNDDNKGLNDLMEEWSSISHVIINNGFGTDWKVGKKVVAEDLFNMIANWWCKYISAANSSNNKIMHAGIMALESMDYSLFPQGNIVNFSMLDTCVKLLNAQLLYNQKKNPCLFNIDPSVSNKIEAYLKESDYSIPVF